MAKMNMNNAENLMNDSNVTKILDGKKIAAASLEDTKQQVASFKQEYSITPKIVVILIGDNPASQIYVTNKIKTCAKVGIDSELIHLSADTTEQEVLATIDKLNADIKVNSVLVQLPLPEHIDDSKLIKSIMPAKDVDGFHPQNIASLYLNDTQNALIPCTALACYEILNKSKIALEGKHIAIIGRSNIVGKPLALLLSLRANSTVSLLHSRSANPQKICKEADIVICAVGIAKMVNREWVKDGAVVIDVGINRVKAEGSDKPLLVGDADYDALVPIVDSITPVPGGVGPMTIAMLMANCLKTAKLQLHHKDI